MWNSRANLTHPVRVRAFTKEDEWNAIPALALEIDNRKSRNMNQRNKRFLLFSLLFTLFLFSVFSFSFSTMIMNWNNQQKKKKSYSKLMMRRLMIALFACHLWHVKSSSAMMMKMIIQRSQQQLGLHLLLFWLLPSHLLPSHCRLLLPRRMILLLEPALLPSPPRFPGSSSLAGAVSPARVAQKSSGLSTAYEYGLLARGCLPSWCYGFFRCAQNSDSQADGWSCSHCCLRRPRRSFDRVRWVVHSSATTGNDYLRWFSGLSHGDKEERRKSKNMYAKDTRKNISKALSLLFLVFSFFTGLSLFLSLFSRSSGWLWLIDVCVLACLRLRVCLGLGSLHRPAGRLAGFSTIWWVPDTRGSTRTCSRCVEWRSPSFPFWSSPPSLSTSYLSPLPFSLPFPPLLRSMPSLSTGSQEVPSKSCASARAREISRDWPNKSRQWQPSTLYKHCQAERFVSLLVFCSSSSISFHSFSSIASLSSRVESLFYFLHFSRTCGSHESLSWACCRSETDSWSGDQHISFEFCCSHGGRGIQWSLFCVLGSSFPVRTGQGCVLAAVRMIQLSYGSEFRSYKIFAAVSLCFGFEFFPSRMVQKRRLWFVTSIALS